MTELNYTITVAVRGGTTSISGTAKLNDGANRVVALLPEGKIVSVVGKARVPVGRDDKAFFNGYQTWTNCREITRIRRTRGLNRLPKALIDTYKFDRYGDYHFVDYPYRPGLFQGDSYCYLRSGSKYRFFGSIDEEPGYTLFRLDAWTGEFTVTRDCGGLKCGGEFHAFDLYVKSGTEDEVFDGWFEAMGITRLPAEPVKGYSSWYNRYEDISRSSIIEDLEGCAKVLEPGDLFQVDDGWEPHVGDWLETDPKKFPEGLKPVADAIHEKGFKAGLWLAPFVANTASGVFRDHPDWFIRVNGEPWYSGSNWGGFCSLDFDNPEVEAYIRETFRRVFDEWGFDLVKLDFLYAAAPFGNERESRAGRMIRAMKLLREICGEHPILGCGVPVMPAFGLVEYCRVSCDVSLDWDDAMYMHAMHRERVSTKHAMETTFFRRQLNGRAFLSDPDVFFLRDDNIRLTPKQKENLAEVDRVIGGVFLCSDNMGAYTPEKISFYKKLLELRPGDYTADPDNITVTTKLGTIDYYSR